MYICVTHAQNETFLYPPCRFCLTQTTDGFINASTMETPDLFI